MIRVLEDNAGRFHLTNGLVMWTAATHPTDEGLARAAAGEWRRGEWAPNEADGWVPTPFEAGRLREVDAGPGFICKTCGGPSPMGVGYTSTEPGARDASMPLSVCGCGASRRPDGERVEVHDDGQALEVRLPSWLTDDERRAIVEQLNAFFVAAVEAVRR